MSISDKDVLWERLKREVKSIDKLHVKVGLIENSKVGKKDRKSKKKHLATIAEIVKIGFYNEVGVRAKQGSGKKWQIPPRPFISTGINQNRKEISRLQVVLIEQVLVGNLDPVHALGLLGEFVVGKIQNRIVEIRKPKNKPSTIDNKGFDNPLIWSGQMKNTISHKVEIKK